MTDTELNQLKQKLQRQFAEMMRDDLPVENDPQSDNQWQRSGN